MKRRDIILVCCLLCAVVAGMFTYTYLERQQAAVSQEKPVEVDTEATKPLITRIDGKHFYRNGVHTIVGEVMMPTPCDLLTYESVVRESYPEQVTFMFDVINTSDVCAQVVTAQRFLVSATSSPEASLQATFAGQPVDLNLVEAAAHESPESFELYSKG